MKKHITSILNNKHSERFIIVLVVLNILVFYCGCDKFFNNYLYIQMFDQLSMVIFTVEYICRVSILTRPKDLFRPMLLMDLIAILPYYLAFLPFKTTFLRIISGYGDFYPTATFGRIVDSIIVIIGAGIHGLIIDVFAPAFIKFINKSKKPALN